MPMTEQGFRRYTYAELLEQQLIRAKDLFGNDIDTSEKSVLGKYIRLNVSDFAQIEEEMEDIYLSRYIDSAIGISLDRLASLTGVKRNGATCALVSVFLENTGKTDVSIPMNTKMINSEGTLYHTTEAVVIPSGLSQKQHKKSVLLECDLFGTVGNLAMITGFRNTSVQSINIISSEIVSPGQEIESDVAFRARWKDTLTGYGINSYDAVVGAVMRVNDVRDCSVFENATNEEIAGSRNGITIHPHSFETIVFGGNEKGAEIAEAIFNKKPIGIGTAGNEIYQVKDKAGFLHEIRFSYAGDCRVNSVIVEIISSDFQPNIDVPIIVKAVQNSLYSLGIGGTLYTFNIASDVQRTGVVEAVDAIYITLDSGGKSYSLTTQGGSRWHKIGANEFVSCDINYIQVFEKDNDTIRYYWDGETVRKVGTNEKV